MEAFEITLAHHGVTKVGLTESLNLLTRAKENAAILMESRKKTKIFVAAYPVQALKFIDSYMMNYILSKYSILFKTER